MEMEPMFSKGCWSLIHGENAATNLHSCTVSGQTQTVWIPDPWYVALMLYEQSPFSCLGSHDFQQLSGHYDSV
uniref:Uncharacterized protein n=1 Tax=Triticum urartu TaxID=4572 RepID=A0A8R7K4V9_TRIUA